ncbi:MAG: hypothetical protein NVS2B4_20580 [Ramlibacter sp.]
MRAVFSLVGLLVVVVIVGMVARKQLAAIAPTAPVPAAGVPPSAMTPKNQVEAARVAAEAALQAPRAMPDESK